MKLIPRKVAIVNVKGHFTVLHLKSFLMFPTAAAYARATSTCVPDLHLRVQATF